jgi:hypothetical protein
MVVTLAAASTSALSALGCNSPPSGPTQPTDLSPTVTSPGGTTVCPQGLAGAPGAPCDLDGLVCWPQYACEGITATARCACTGGAFACTDVSGHPVADADASPSCPPRRDAEACPSSIAKGAIVPCTEPYLVCTYPTDCDASSVPPAFRQCTCAAGPLPDGTEGLAFRCPDDCPYVAAPIPMIKLDAAVD